MHRHCLWLSKLIVSIYCLFVSGQLLGQNGYFFNTRRLTVKDGLAHQEVYALHQDTRGFIWIGTRSGLSRYDGYNFTTFTKEKNALANNSIHALGEDDAGHLWLYALRQFGHKSAVLSIDLLNTITGQVQHFEEAFPNRPFDTKDIRNFYTSPQRVLFFFAKNKLWQYTKAKGFENLPLPAGFVPEGCTPQLQHWGKLGNELVKINARGNIALRLLPDSLGNTQAAWLDEKFVHLVRPRGIHKVYAATPADIPPAARALPFSDISLVRYDAGSRLLWLAGARTLHVIDEAGKLIYTGDNSTEASFERVIRAIMTDRQGTAWVATESGIFLIHARKEKFTRYLYNNQPAKKEKPNIQCRELLQYGNTLYAGTYRGTYQIDLATGNNKVLTPLTDNGQQIGSRFAILQYNDDQLLLGAKYLVLTDARSGTELRLIKGPHPQRNGTWSLFKDKYNRVLIGADKGLFLYDPRVSDTVRTFVQYNQFTELADKFIIDVMKDRSGINWIITNNGLYVFDEDKGITAHYGTAEAAPRRLMSDNMQHLYQDADGLYWLSTGNAGLIRWNRSTGQQTQFSKESGLSSNNIYAAYEDKRGYLWLSSDYGLMRFSKKEAQVTLFTPEDGISHYEFNRISHYQSPDGRIFFGGLNGVTAFNPEDFYDATEAHASTVMISGFQQYIGDKGNLLDQTGELLATNRIVLNPSDRFFSITLALPDYMSTTRAVYYYMIDGVDKEWNKSTNNEIRYGRLPYGKFVLRIKAQTSNGHLTKELAIQILSKRPWFLRWWFYVLVVLLVAGSVRFFYSWRIRQLQLRKKELETIVEERTVELKEDKAIIEQQARALKQLDEMKSNFFVNVAHELRTPLTLLAGPVNRLVQDTREASDSFPYLKLMQQSVQQLQHKVNEILDLSKLDAGKLRLNEAPLHLGGFLELLTAPFGHAAAQKQVQFALINHIPADAWFLLDKECMLNVLNNLLSNALKFTPAKGRIHCTASINEGFLQFTVADSGPGIPLSEQENIFKRYFQVKNAHSMAGGTGIGLAFARELVLLMQGSIAVMSKEGQGASFIVSVPAKPAEAPALPNEVRASDFADEETSATPLLPQPRDITILLVEDNPGLQQFISLELKDFNIITAGNGAEAIEVLDNKTEKYPPVQLIISDIMMPVMDGFAFVDYVKQQEALRQIPIIILTARTQLADKLRALRVGVDDYMVKPFVTEELVARVQNLLGSYYARQQFVQQANEGDAVEADTATVQPAWLAQLETVIKTKLSSRIPFTVDDIAADLFISTRQLQRNIKNGTGLTLNNYIREMRLHEARQLLEQRSFATIAEYSYAVGFNDPHYFSKLFNERFGKKPADYLTQPV